MADNGRLPKSALSPIAGGGQLEHHAAAAWNSLAAHIFEKTGQKIAASESYRDYQRQVYFWDLYQSGKGNLAARPGTSNHGLGLAVDLVTPVVRSLIDKYGAAYGWSKSWSDAQSEWWHILYQSGHYSGKDPGPGYVIKDKQAEKLKRKIKRQQAKKGRQGKTKAAAKKALDAARKAYDATKAKIGHLAKRLRKHS